MVEDRQFSRRNFLKLAGVGLLALSGCHRFSLFGNNGKLPSYGGIDRLRVMSFNIANARGPTENFFRKVPSNEVYRNLDRIVELILDEKIDVACMNEVDFNSFRTNNINQAKYMASRISKATGYVDLIEDAFFSMPDFLDIGNAVISRYPLRVNKQKRFGRNADSNDRHLFKSYVDFSVLLGERSLDFILTHYDDRKSRVRNEETEMILERVRSKSKPFVILGDLNSEPTEKCILTFLAHAGLHNPYLGPKTFPSWNPKIAIDHILVSEGLGICSYGTRDLSVSDHLPVIGEIIL